MPARSTTIKLPTLSGGVAKTSPTKRRPDQVEEADNVFLSLERGLEKRQGTTFISSDGAEGSLNITEAPTDPANMLFHTFRTQKNNAVIIVLIPTAADANVLQFFNANTGAKITASSINTAGDMSTFKTYLQTGSAALADKIRFTRVKDSLLILNTEVEAKFKTTAEGAILNYTAPFSIASIGGQANPDGATSIPLAAGGNVAAKNTIGVAKSTLTGGANYSITNKDSEFRERAAAIANATVVDMQNSISVKSILELGEAPDSPRFLITTREGQDADRQAQWPVLRTPFVKNSTAIRAAMVALHGKGMQDVTYTISGSTYGSGGGAAAAEVPTSIAGEALLGNPKLGDGFIFKIRESTAGAPSGFYRVIGTSVLNGLPARKADNSADFNYFDRTHEHSTTYAMTGFTAGPPFYQRIRTEEEGSVLDSTTLPYIIAFNGNASSPDFALSRTPWVPRLNGDTENNPGPSFLAQSSNPYDTSSPTGAKITAMSWWRNRLWLASGTTIVSSQAGNPYALFIDDAEAITDSDPIDLSVNESDAAKIQWIVPFEASLFLGTDGSEQFALTGSDNFISPLSASLDSTSEYSLTDKAEPLKVGNNLFFTDEGRLFVYSGQGQGQTVSFSISDSVLGYFPSTVSQSIVAPASSLVLFRSGDTSEEKLVYIYQQRAVPGNQAGQVAFYRWSFLNNLHHIFTLGNTFYAVSRAGTKYFLESMDMNAPTITDTLLDRRTTISGGSLTFVANENITRFSLPYLATNPIIIDQSDYAKITPHSIGVDGSGFTQIDIVGDVTGKTFICGEQFNMSVILSPFILRDGSNTHVDAHVQLKDLATRHYKTGQYEIAVTRQGRNQTIATFDPHRTTNPFVTDDASYYQTNGQAQARIAANADDVSIVLQSTGHVPVNITNVEARVVAQIGIDSSTE